MSKTSYDLLTEPLFHATVGEQAQTLTLPGCLAALSRGEPLVMRRLRPHQRHPWHTFTVQLAAIALHRAGASAPWPGEDAWRGALLALTGSREPWCLVVDDLAQPAFMQPPVPERAPSVLKSSAREPDVLDLLQLAKNHDVKRAKMGSAQPQDWAFVLIALQTFEGFGGAGNYGVFRMNGGLGNRPDVSVCTEEPRFSREVGLLLSRRPELLASYPYADGGIALLWLEPWDGKASCPLNILDPFVIEVCRRVRIAADGASLEARFGTSKSARVEQELRGNTGDLWTPIRKKDGAGLTMGAQGPTYARIHDWALSGDWQPSPALDPDGAAAVELVVRALIRGQGTTDGYHERRIPISGTSRRGWGQLGHREQLAALSSSRITLIGDFRRKVLRQALLTYLQGGRDERALNLSDDGAKPFLEAFERDVDDSFFLRLFDDVERDEVDRAVEFERHLRDLGRRQLERCFEGAPTADARQLRAVARADSLFRGKCHRILKQLAHAEAAAREERSAS